jgi:hypothetical protein
MTALELKQKADRNFIFLNMNMRTFNVKLFLFIITISNCHCSNPTGNSNIDSTGLVASFPFDANLRDVSGNNNHGNSGSQATYAENRSSAAQSSLNFDGVDDKVVVPRSDTLDLGVGDFTLSAWIKAGTSQLKYPEIIANRTMVPDGFLFGLTDGGQLFFQSGTENREFSTSPDLRDNNWHNVVATRSGGLVRYYVDKISVGEYINTDNITTPGPYYIGWDIGNPTMTYFNGSLDDVRVYNRSLLLDEIANL